MAEVMLKIVIAGSVDSGKSTLIGRLLHDTDSLTKGRKEAIEQSCKRRGVDFEWAFFMDALQAERDQNVTLDTTQARLRLPGREIVLIDAPGHAEFLQNMITGAAQADAAFLVIDAREGIGEQGRRHALMLALLGVRQAAVLVNKMDNIEFSAKRFAGIRKECGSYLGSLGLKPRAVIPLSARNGDGVVSLSKHMPWYKGKTVLQALKDFNRKKAGKAPLRFQVQDVYKSGDRRIIAGRVESGEMKLGDTLLFSPGGATARVRTVECWPKNKRRARAGESIGITLDAPVFVERGQVASHVTAPPVLTTVFAARLFWLGSKSLTPGERHVMRIGCRETAAEITRIERVFDAKAPHNIKAASIKRGQVALALMRSRGVIAVDEGSRFVLLENQRIAGGGLLSTQGFFDRRRARAEKVKSTSIHPVSASISASERARMNGHLGGVLWFTGLSGSGKSTLASELSRRLFDKGMQVTVLDGDNIRGRLNRDLGFSPSERHENIRRAAEVAALFAEAGMIAIVAFISPYEEDRKRARAAAPEAFHLVHVKASLKTCEKRDAKGLYKKARRGEIKKFTGVSAPYEAPRYPDLVIDTERLSVEQSVTEILRYIDRYMVRPARDLS